VPAGGTDKFHWVAAAYKILAEAALRCINQELGKTDKVRGKS